MTMKPNGMAVFALVAVWVCGYFAEAQTDLGGLMQDMVPRDSKTCKEMRYNLEMMFFNTYKGSIPRRMLKQVLPGLAEPLLPIECIRSGGHGKWLLETSSSSLSTAANHQGSSKPIGGFFTLPLTNTKDPGNQPPPGLLRDPMKDPGDRPSGTVSVTQPLGGHPWAPGLRDPFVQPFRGGFYGDRLPLGRKKRSTEEESAAHVRHKRANGEEEKNGLSFDNFLFNSFTFPSLFPSLDQLFAPRTSNNAIPQARTNNVRQKMYGPQPNTFYGNSPVSRQAATKSQAPAPVSSPALALAQTPLAAPVAPGALQAYQSPASAASPPLLQSPANRASPTLSNVLQPAGAQPLGNQASGMPASGFSPLLAPSTSVQPSAFSSPLPQPQLVIPSQPMIPGPGGMIYGDRIPGYGATGRRVKRASDNSSPDMVTFGDFSMPADTFRKFMYPRGSRSDDTSSDYRRPSHAPPPPVYPPPHLRQLAPMYRPGGYPFSAPFAPARQSPRSTAKRAYNLYKVRVLQARQALQQLRNAAPQVSPSSLFARAGQGAQAAATAIAMAPSAPMATVPLGAALPVYGNHPRY